MKRNGPYPAEWGLPPPSPLLHRGGAVYQLPEDQPLRLPQHEIPIEECELDVPLSAPGTGWVEGRATRQSNQFFGDNNPNQQWFNGTVAPLVQSVIMDCAVWWTVTMTTREVQRSGTSSPLSRSDIVNNQNLGFVTTQLKAKISWADEISSHNVVVDISSGIVLDIPASTRVNVEIVGPATDWGTIDGTPPAPNTAGVPIDTVIDCSITPTHNPRGSRVGYLTQRLQATPTAGISFHKPPHARRAKYYQDGAAVAQNLQWTAASVGQIFGIFSQMPGMLESDWAYIPGPATFLSSGISTANTDFTVLWEIQL